MEISNVKIRIKRSDIRFQLWKYIKKFIYDKWIINEEILNKNRYYNCRYKM